MKSKIKGDVTSTYVKTIEEATEYCNISEKLYFYPFSVRQIYIFLKIVYLFWYELYQ